MDPIVETMLSRTKDSNVSCRVFVITSLKRLHEPDEKKDKATIEFKYLMRRHIGTCSYGSIK